MVDTQDNAVEDGSGDAGNDEKLAGIVAQVRGDIHLGHEGDVRELLRERLRDAALTVSDEEFETLLAEVQAP